MVLSILLLLLCQNRVRLIEASLEFVGAEPGDLLAPRSLPETEHGQNSTSSHIQQEIFH